MTITKRVGLARALSKRGYCSRSQASALVRAGRVSVNGRRVTDPEAPVHPYLDRLQVDGSNVRDRERIYVVMNKPRGVITTASDAQSRPTVYGLLESGHEWVGPVGRLDKASEGLLLLTNDSEWAARVTAPSRHLDKTYHVQVNRYDCEEALAAMVQGVVVVGDCLRAKTARMLRLGEKNSWLEITLDEGKNRQIRRMLQALGMEVLRLVRVSLGPLQLGELKKGAVRRLTDAEKRSLDQALSQGDHLKGREKNNGRAPKDVG